MSKTLASRIEKIWYKDIIVGTWFSPFSYLYQDVIRFRRFLYRIGIFKTHTLPVPVVIVGNITVGGTGKTPLIIYLAKLLKQTGFNPGVISRGYGGQASAWPQAVSVESDTKDVGDEAILLAKHCDCPVAVGPVRADSARMLIERANCDLILSDDGLQHYALNRDVEIAVIDGQRRFGNGFCLPAGPLREPVERLQGVDFVIVNGDKVEEHEFSMQVDGDTAINLLTGEERSLSDFSGQPCHALAGIGNPDRFFGLLSGAGIAIDKHVFPDHHQFKPADIQFNDDAAVLMTEKDAVKCTGFASPKHWYIPVTAKLEPSFATQLLTLLREKNHG